MLQLEKGRNCHNCMQLEVETFLHSSSTLMNHFVLALCKFTKELQFFLKSDEEMLEI